MKYLLVLATATFAAIGAGFYAATLEPMYLAVTVFCSLICISIAVDNHPE